MNDLLSFFTFRTMILLFSTTFSILVVMLLLNIITVNDVVVILKLSPEAANALRLIVERLQEVTSNVLDILSQLMNRLFGWAGVNIDLSKIKVDVHQNSGVAIPVDTSPPATHH